MKNCENNTLNNGNCQKSQEYTLQLQQEIDKLRQALSNAKQYIEETEFRHKQEQEEMASKLQDCQDLVKLEQGKSQLLEQLANEKKVQMEELVNERNKQEKDLRIQILKMQQQELQNKETHQSYEYKFNEQSGILEEVQLDIEEIKRQFQDACEMIRTVTSSMAKLETGLQDSLSRETNLHVKFQELQNNFINMEQKQKMQEHIMRQMEQQLNENQAKCESIQEEEGLDKEDRPGNSQIQSPNANEIAENEFEELRDDDTKQREPEQNTS